MTAAEMLEAAIAHADAVRLEIRARFQAQWGLFLKCTLCGAARSRSSFSWTDCTCGGSRWHLTGYTPVGGHPEGPGAH